MGGNGGPNGIGGSNSDTGDISQKELVGSIMIIFDYFIYCIGGAM